VQDVTTWKLLRTETVRNTTRSSCWLSRLRAGTGFRLNRGHFLATDDTHILPGDLICRCIRIPLIHVSGCIPVAKEVHNATSERPDGHHNVPQDVNGQAVESEENSKEGQIDHELQQVGQKIKVKHPAALLFPSGHVNLHLIHIILIR
jgi:hypothetical protein